MSLRAAATNKASLDDLLKRRFFFAPGFEAYGGERGLFDLGPIGCGVKNNILAAWRQHFIVEEGMLEVECTSLTPIEVLRVSGHLERFKDVMVRDMVTGECFRADHLLEDVMSERLKDAALDPALRAEYEDVRNEAGNYTLDKLREAFTKHKIVSPTNGNPLGQPEDFNMMFESTLGPRQHAGSTGKSNVAFLRPETAQGIFLCFPRLYEFNNTRLPFAAAQIGLAFRNEIAPRNGLLRVREFTMAEIEHFLDPLDKSHVKFQAVADFELPLLPRAQQVPGAKPLRMKIGEAVSQGTVNNETLGYYMVRIYTFLVRIGIKESGIRFRQHRADEMAHYACDCWDAEIETTYGWIECVGCADRSAYDLTRHGQASGKNMTAQKVLPEPIVEQCTVVSTVKKVLGPKLRSAPKNTLKDLVAKLEGMSSEEAQALEAKLAKDGVHTVDIEGYKVDVTPDMVEINRVERRTNVRTFTPSVIEPSFGIGRIMYALFEHSFDIRPDADSRGWVALPALIAPLKCALFPLLTNNPAKYNPILESCAAQLRARSLTFRLDDSSTTVGKRYVRFDEIGTPFAITVDPTSIAEAEQAQPVTVTVRDRNSMQQIRVPVADVGQLISSMCTEAKTWNDAVAQYGLVAAAAAAEEQ